MTADSVRKRATRAVTESQPDKGSGNDTTVPEPHPGGKVKYPLWLQLVRFLTVTTWFNLCCASIACTQFLGAPLYWISRDWYYAYMALTKQSFGLLLNTVMWVYCPTTVRVSWSPELAGQFHQAEDGRLETNFPARLILITNHQIYTDWLYLWWFAYTSRMHGHIYIILKETLKYIPILGPGMMFFGFIFMSRKWAADKPRIQYRLQKLKVKSSGPMSGTAGLDPMWLLIFPEGTNLSANTRKRSAKWAEHQGIPDTKYQVLPRSTGLHFCLTELKDTVEWIYDCTTGYEGTPANGYAQDIFTVRSLYFQGRTPKSVNMYWRRFAVKDIPMDEKEFEQWMLLRWREKDELLRHFYSTGRFPAGIAGAEPKGESQDGYINTKVKLRNWYDVTQIFAMMATLVLVVHVITKFCHMFL